MKLNEVASNIFYHGSYDKLEPGTILTPRTDYEERWKDTDFYSILEKYRPESMLAHKDAVFMVKHTDDIDLAGGGTEWIFEVIPLGKVEKHDLNWGSELSMLLSTGDLFDMNPDRQEAIRICAENYWNGKPHFNESVWEYLTPSARILKVYEY